MIHARTDYDPIQDPRTGPERIGDDEPVMVFRAKDRLFIAVLSAYQGLLHASDAKIEMMRAVQSQIGRASAWQKRNVTKTPDMPKGSMRIG